MMVLHMITSETKENTAFSGIKMRLWFLDNWYLFKLEPYTVMCLSENLLSVICKVY